MPEEVKQESAANNISAHRRFFFSFCEKAYYYEYDRQNQLQSRSGGILTVASGLCAAAWYFSSYHLLFENFCFCYAFVFALTWLGLSAGIYFLAHAVLYRGIESPANMDDWNKWISELEEFYKDDSATIEREMLKQLTNKLAETQTRYAVSNEKRYKSLKWSQVFLVISLVLVFLLSTVGLFADKRHTNGFSPHSTNIEMSTDPVPPPPQPAPPPPDTIKTGGK